MNRCRPDCYRLCKSILSFQDKKKQFYDTEDRGLYPVLFLETVDTGRKPIEVESVKEKHAKHDADCDFFSSFASETGKYRKAGFERAAKQRL